MTAIAAGPDFCGHLALHEHHPWRRRYTRLLIPGRRRMCPGIYGIGHCVKDETHGPHWYGEMCDELCLGLGLAGICKHGVQMLNDCVACRT